MLLLSSCYNIDTFSSSNELKKDEAFKNVIIVGVDGAGSNFNHAYTPKTMEIFNDGAITYTALSANPTISAQSWGSMLTGIIPDKHNFTNDSIATYKNNIHDTYPSIFKQIRNSYKDDVLASYTNWNPINIGIVEDNINVVKYTNSDDNELTKAIISFLEIYKTRFMFIQLDNVDHIGHTYGYESTNYYEALKQADNNIYDIYNAIKLFNDNEDTLFIVTADHGGNGYSHGGYSESEKYVFTGFKNKNINNTIINNMYIRDIPAIVSYHLNINPSSSWDSYIPKNLFLDNLDPKSRKINFNNLLNIDDLYNYINKDNILVNLSFDGNLNNINDNFNIKSNGVITYDNGISNKAIKLDKNNYLSINNLKFKNDSFTISTFIKIKNKNGDPVLFSNKNWIDGKNDGFVVSLRDDDIKFNVGKNVINRFDDTIHYPNKDYINDWFHIAISYNKKNKTISTYINFSLESVKKISNEVNFDSSLSFNIGQDGTGKYNLVADMLLDEFMILNTCVNENDMYNLKKYYSKH